MADQTGTARPTPTVISLGIRYRTMTRWVPVLTVVVGLVLLRVDVVLGAIPLLVGALVTPSVLRLEWYRRSEAASRRLLEVDPQPGPVALVPVVTETRVRRRLRMQFVLRDAEGVDRAMAWIVPDRERFDPHAPVLVHGAPEPGRSVALTSTSGWTALLPLGPLRPVPSDATGTSAARTAQLVALLGWEGEAGSGDPAVARPGTRVTPDQFGDEQRTTGAPAGLAAATAASMERVERVRRRVDSSPLPLVAVIAIGLSGGLAPWLPVPLIAAGLVGLARLRSWQVHPLAQEVVRMYGVSEGEASKLAGAFLGLHNAKLPPQA